MDSKILVVLVVLGVVSCVSAIGHINYKYGFSTKGKYGAAQVEAGADDHKWGFSVNNHHKDGVSYIKQSGDNTHHGGFEGGFGGGAGGAGGGAGGAGGVGGGFGFGGGFGGGF